MNGTKEDKTESEISFKIRDYTPLLRLVLLCLQESAEPPVVPAPGHLVGTDLPDLGTGYGRATVGGWGSLVLILVHNKSFLLI